MVALKTLRRNAGTEAKSLLRQKPAVFKQIFNQLAKGIATGEAFNDRDIMDWAQKHFRENLFSSPGQFHFWLAKHLANFHKKRGRKEVVVAPRGNAKSTWISLVYVVLAALEGWEPYILLVSDSATQARLLLDAVKDAIEFSEELAESYPAISGRGRPWREDRIKLKNGCMIEAIGKGMKLRGRRKGKDRPSLVILDDPQNDENVESPQQREKDLSWLNKTLLNCGNKRTNFLVIGTAIHRESLVLSCANNAAWKSFFFRAIISEPERRDLWEQWQEIYLDRNNDNREESALAFYKKHEKEMLKGSEVLWEAEESLYDLMKLRVLIGVRDFDSEKQNNPRRADTNEFPDDYFGNWLFLSRKKWPNENQFEHKVIAIDPSKGKDANKGKKKGDYSAIVLLGRLEQRLYARFDIKRRPVKRIVVDIVSHALAFKPDAIVLETNQFQELMAEDLEEELRINGLDIQVICIDNSVNKQIRIRRLGSRFSQREYVFFDSREEPNTKLCIQQLEDFPNGDHDDGPDALEMGTRVMVDMVNGSLENPFKGDNIFENF